MNRRQAIARMRYLNNKLWLNGWTLPEALEAERMFLGRQLDMTHDGPFEYKHEAEKR